MAETKSPAGTEQMRQSGMPARAEAPVSPVAQVGERIATLTENTATVGPAIDALAKLPDTSSFTLEGKPLDASASVSGPVPSAEIPTGQMTATAPEGPTVTAAAPKTSEMPTSTAAVDGRLSGGSKSVDTEQDKQHGTPTAETKPAAAGETKGAEAASKAEGAQPAAEAPLDPKARQDKLLKDVQEGKKDLHDAIQEYAQTISETSRTQLRVDFARTVMDQMDKMNAAGPDQKSAIFRLFLERANDIRDKIAEVDALEQSLIELPDKIEKLKAERKTQIDAAKAIKDKPEPTDSKQRADWVKARTKADFDLWSTNISLLNSLYMMHTGTARAAELHAEIDRRQGVSQGFDIIKDWALAKLQTEIAEVKFAVEAAGNGAVAAMIL